MLNQLFSKKPDKEIMNKILRCFSLDSLDDKKFFTKKYLADINTVHNIKKIIDDLSKYYIPCKRKTYLENINEKKAITILRQFIRVFDYFLFSKEKYINGEKYIIYQVNLCKNKNIIKLKKNEKKYVVYFD
tara:strand:+ start:112 stop:504 length:393 start_codon:yes stop_codon:yes gene_type:complete